MAEMNPYGYVKEGKIYLKGYLEFEDRAIGVVKESEEASIEYFVKRFEIASKKVYDLEEAVKTAENKGSYLMKLIHLRKYLAEFDGLGDFIPLFEKLDELEEELRAMITVNREKNLEIKKALLAEAEEIKDDPDWKDTTEQLLEIKRKWVKTGNVSDEFIDDTDGKFKALLDAFFEKKQAFYEEKKRVMAEREEHYMDIIRRARRLVSMRDLREAMNRYKSLRFEWNRVGMIDKRMASKLQWDFRKIGGQIAEMQKRERMTRQRQMDAKAIESKRQLLNQVLALREPYDEPKMNYLRHLQFQWKKTGIIRSPEVGAMNHQFKFACDIIKEKFFLDSAAKKIHENYETLDEKEQINIKITMVERSLEVDNEELQTLQKNTERSSFSSYGDYGRQGPPNKILQTKLGNLQRKIEVKQHLVSELKDKLNQ